VADTFSTLERRGRGLASCLAWLPFAWLKLKALMALSATSSRRLLPSALGKGVSGLGDLRGRGDFIGVFLGSGTWN
jgi:hypothetical protein